MTRLLPALILAAAAALFAMPALAQDDSATTAPGGEKINTVIVYGNDPCPKSTGDEITVCARKDESERYRIPEPLRSSESPANDAWNNRVLAYETVGKHGALSCSPVGGGGWTGCLRQMIDTAYAEKDSDASLRFSELIAEEREKRLSTIDEEAAETQARVEEVERQYEARQNAERKKESAGGSSGQ